MNLPEDHDHDEDGDCIIPAGFVSALPVWRFSAWDVVGITLHTIGGFAAQFGNGLALLSRECQAMANYSRAKHDEREARRAYEAHQRAIGEDIRALIEGDGT